uniref:N-alpha-acetyltransferase 40 n=1 Tax=Ditylenchus dipsaci TaxID=166011 RepID=A0A915CPI3_9BILA
MITEAERKKLVKKANKLTSEKVNDILMSAPTTQELLGDSLSFECCWSTHLAETTCDWIFDLFDRNMADLYLRSQWGYDIKAKKQELQATTARYLILNSNNSFDSTNLVGYVHYRFVMENGYAVLYCYEIQIEPKYQKQGIGSVMMYMLEELAKSIASMEKIMCTVLTYNLPSLAFFEKNGFTQDEEMCPKPRDERDYFILKEFTHHITNNDDFWAFLFNDNAEDKKEEQCCGEWEYSKKYHVHFDAALLNQVFCTSETHPSDIFRSAWAIFEVNRSMITFIPPNDAFVQFDQINPSEDLFVKEKVNLESHVSQIALHGDRIYTLLGKGRSMKLTELIEANEQGTHNNTHPINCPDPITFIGNLQIYFKDFFRLDIDETFEDYNIRRVEGRWPSSNTKHIESIVSCPPEYPPMIDLLSPIINGKRKERIFDVNLISTPTPADGIFVQFASNDALEQRVYIQDELKHLFSYGKLKPVSIIQKRWPCIYDSGTNLYRCRITGRSTAANRSPLAMVECVDSGYITFAHLNQLFDVPQYLLGVPPSGAYIVLTDRDGICWPMSHPSEKQNWEIAFSKSRSNNTKVQAYILDKATENHYSGRRKSEVFKAQLKIDIFCQDPLIVPDSWRKKEKVYFPKT